MSDLGYLIWFIATAAIIVVVLATGTLAAAGLLAREDRPSSRPSRPAEHADTGNRIEPRAGLDGADTTTAPPQHERAA